MCVLAQDCSLDPRYTQAPSKLMRSSSQWDTGAPFASHLYLKTFTQDKPPIYRKMIKVK